MEEDVNDFYHFYFHATLTAVHQFARSILKSFCICFGLLNFPPKIQVLMMQTSMGNHTNVTYHLTLPWARKNFPMLIPKISPTHRHINPFTLTEHYFWVLQSFCLRWTCDSCSNASNVFSRSFFVVHCFCFCFHIIVNLYTFVSTFCFQSNIFQLIWKPPPIFSGSSTHECYEEEVAEPIWWMKSNYHWKLLARV